jgi:hypothetical protein
MISLSDEQLRVVMVAASALDWEKRGAFLERVAAVLRLKTGQASDADVAAAADRALRSLCVISAA